MAKTVFVSYSHKQGDWVLDRLLPILKAAGVDAWIDRERFELGKDLAVMMDEQVQRADLTLAILSDDYLASEACRREMELGFSLDRLVPVQLFDCKVPDPLRARLYSDLRDDQDADAWERVLKVCDASLGTSAPEWLSARDDLRLCMTRKESVNLVTGSLPSATLLTHLRGHEFPDLGSVSLESGRAASRPALIGAMLAACGAATRIPPPPEDLVTLDRVLGSRKTSRLALVRTDMLPHHDWYQDSVPLFAALRDLVMEQRKLVLVVQSRQNVANLLPRNHPLSSLNLKTIELRV